MVSSKVMQGTPTLSVVIPQTAATTSISFRPKSIAITKTTEAIKCQSVLTRHIYEF
jgi:hypothetical protein